MKTMPFFSNVAPASREPRSYSLVETAQLLRISFADLHELIVHDTIHAEAGPRGSRVSQRHLLDYVTRREKSAATGANLFMGFGSKR